MKDLIVEVFIHIVDVKNVIPSLTGNPEISDFHKIDRVKTRPTDGFPVKPGMTCRLYDQRKQ